MKKRILILMILGMLLTVSTEYPKGRIARAERVKLNYNGISISNPHTGNNILLGGKMFCRQENLLGEAKLKPSQTDNPTPLVAFWEKTIKYNGKRYVVLSVSNIPELPKNERISNLLYNRASGVRWWLGPDGETYVDTRNLVIIGVNPISR